jgi:hypothetical protein
VPIQQGAVDTVFLDFLVEKGGDLASGPANAGQTRTDPARQTESTPV